MDGSKSRLIDIAVIVSVLIVILALVLPVLAGSRTNPPEIYTNSLILTMSMAFEHYASDFNGNYPPDTIDTKPLMLDGTPLTNTSQCLCYFTESQFIATDGRKSGCYETFKTRHKQFQGSAETRKEIKVNGIQLQLSFDHIVDQRGNPLFYDERKSEEAKDGLNAQSFVIISGGKADTPPPAVNLSNIDPGDLSMFKPKQLVNFDTVRKDYQTGKMIEPLNNDDLFND
ncbi:MAG: hypothetical protein ABIF71_00585 [Planctomycetota bacterium]